MVAQMNITNLRAASTLIETVLSSQRSLDKLDERVGFSGVHSVDSDGVMLSAKDEVESGEISRALKNILNYRIDQAVRTLRSDFDINIFRDDDDI